MRVQPNVSKLKRAPMHYFSSKRANGGKTARVKHKGPLVHESADINEWRSTTMSYRRGGGGGGVDRYRVLVLPTIRPGTSLSLIAPFWLTERDGETDARGIHPSRVYPQHPPGHFGRTPR